MSAEIIALFVVLTVAALILIAATWQALDHLDRIACALEAKPETPQEAAPVEKPNVIQFRRRA